MLFILNRRLCGLDVFASEIGSETDLWCKLKSLVIETDDWMKHDTARRRHDLEAYRVCI